MDHTLADLFGYAGSGNPRILLVTHLKRHLRGDALEDHLDYISTLSDESCDQYLEAVESQDDIAAYLRADK